jgi:hypothetical protein
VRIDVERAVAVAPGEVGDGTQRGRARPALQTRHELAQRLFGGVAANDVIHERVADQLLVIVGGRKPAEDDRRIGMVAFDQLGHGQRAVRVRQPVQVNAERRGVEGGDQWFGIEGRLVEHPHGQVEDAHAEAGALQVLGHRGEPDRVHLEDRGGGYQVAHRAVQNGLPTEVIHARRM